MLPFVICARNFELAMALAESIHRAVLLIPEWRDQPPIRYAAANTELFPVREGVLIRGPGGKTWTAEGMGMC